MNPREFRSMFFSSSSYGFGLIPQFRQKTSEYLNTTSGADRAVIDNVIEHSPDYNVTLNHLKSKFPITGEVYDEIAFFVIGGLTGYGKSTLAGSIIADLDSYFENYPPDIRPVIIYHDFGLSVPPARYKGLVKSEMGHMTDDEYVLAESVDNQIDELAIKYARGNVIIVRENVLYTEEFDKNGNRIGSPRGSVNGMINKLKRGIPVYAGFMKTPEILRKENVKDRETMRATPEKEIIEAERSIGIVDDMKDPKLIKERYERDHFGISKQHREAVAKNIYHLVEIGEINDSYIRSMTFNGLLEAIQKDSQLFDFMVNEYTIPRLTTRIYGEHNPMVAKLNNPALEKGRKRKERRELLQKREVITYLRYLASSTGNRELANDLTDLGFSPLSYNQTLGLNG